MSVHERQNKQWSIDRLVAQRLLYSYAKIVENWRLVSMLVVAVLLLCGLAVGPISQVAPAIIVFLWFVDQVALVPLAGRMKKEAAIIQEDFDCFVLDIPWPEHRGVERPTQDRVDELARKGKKKASVTKCLEDWYGKDDIPAEELAARLHCQKVNCWWDGRLHKKWIVSICFALLVTLGVCLLVAVLVDVALLEVVLVAAAALRLLAWLWMEIQAQLVSKRRMEKLHRYLSLADTQARQMNLCDVRLVQATIFEHRGSGPMVPDWFYHLKKRQLDECRTDGGDRGAPGEARRSNSGSVGAGRGT